MREKGLVNYRLMKSRRSTSILMRVKGIFKRGVGVITLFHHGINYLLLKIFLSGSNIISGPVFGGQVTYASITNSKVE